MGDRRRLWRQRNFRIAWTAGFVNDTGDWVFNVALPVFVFVETRSGAQTALLFVCQLLPAVVLGPIAGTIVDRVDLRRCLIATNVAQAVALVPLLAVSADRVWPAYFVVAAQSALSQLNDPANVAIIPRVVDGEDDLTRANAALGASQSIARLLGAPLGGLLVAWGSLTPVVAIDAASFLLVAAALSFIRADTAPAPGHETHQSLDLRASWRLARRHRPLAGLVVVQGFSQIAQGAFVVVFVAFVVSTLGDGGAQLGLIRGTMAIGALVGAAIIARTADRTTPVRLLGLGSIGLGVVSFAFWNAPTVTTALWVFVVLFALSGIPGSAMNVGLYTTIQTRSPAGAIGRISGLISASSAIGMGIGSIAAGFLIDHVPLRAVLNAEAGIHVVAGVLVVTRLARADRGASAIRPRAEPA